MTRNIAYILSRLFLHRFSREPRMRVFRVKETFTFASNNWITE